MKKLEYIRWADPPLWKAILAGSLPLWMLAVALTAEGFPRPPVSIELITITSFILLFPVIIVLLWLGWLTPDLLLYSLFPFTFMFIFDEISTRYKTPLLLLCAFMLTIGMLGYRLIHSRSLGLAWLILLLTAIATWLFASHAVQNYWQMAGNLGYFECSPDALGCAPLTGRETPWWILFFSL